MTLAFARRNQKLPCFVFGFVFKTRTKTMRSTFILSTIAGAISAISFVGNSPKAEPKAESANPNPLVAVVTVPSNPMVPVQAQDDSKQSGVIPIGDNNPDQNKPDQSNNQLNRIESKIDELLSGQTTIRSEATANTKAITSNQDSIRIEIMEAAEHDKTNTDRIVDAILSLKKESVQTAPAPKVEPKKQTETKPDTSSKIATRSVTRIVVASKSSPRWNLNGSMQAAYNKSKMVSHLATSSNHRRIQSVFSRSELNTLTLGQLWTLHDDDHEGRTITRSRFFQRDVIPIGPGDPPTDPSPPVYDDPDPCPGGT